jgi:hypothetical protein
MNTQPTKEELVAELKKRWREVVDEQLKNMRSLTSENTDAVVEKARELNAKLRMITSQIPEESMHELRTEFFTKTEEE